MGTQKNVSMRQVFERPKQMLKLMGKAKKRKCLVSGYPTDPNILGPTQTFFKAFWDIEVYFKPF